MASEINYEDERFGKVESDKEQALTELEETYGGMINATDEYYDAQIEASKEWAEKQTQIQNEQTDFAIEEINQQKDQAEKDYIKEQSGAYVDWKKQSSQHGVNAEAMAAQGMQDTGFSESSQVSMYNTYQNRVAAARESYNQAVLNYNNSITQARLQNNSALAEIAYQTLQQQLELSLEGFQYKNSLILDQADKKTELESLHYQRYLDVLEQINQENALAEEQRQFDAVYGDDAEQDGLVIAKDSDSEPEGITFTYESAIAYLKKNGVGFTKWAAVMPQDRWEKLKESGSKVPHVKNYNSYAEYLEDYVAYCMEQKGG